MVRRRLVGPPGFPIERYAERLQHSAVRNQGSAGTTWRRRACKHSPILFALYFLRDHTELPTGDGVVHALSDFHVAIAMAAKRWTRQDIGPKEIRDAWIAPRHAAKSTWLFLILALWSLAYGHRKFIVVYADTADQARLHLATLRLELSRNERLRRDFPELCEPMRDAGRPVMNTKDGYVAANGHAIMVKGMDSATLGVKLGARRPDALFFDDMEPKESRYNAEMKARRLKDLVEAIFPCNHSAVVQIAGTTVMAGSIVHEMIEGASWVTDQNIVVRHFLPIISDPVTGEERSLWPAKWSLEFLYEERRIDPASWAKNYLNQPVNADGTYWDAEDFTYKDLSPWVDERILVIDPAAKSKKSNDETALGLLAHAGNVRKVMVEHVQGVRMKPDELCRLVLKLVERYQVRRVLVDTANGGDHVLNSLHLMPHGVTVEEVDVRKMRRGKADRFGDLLRLYERGRVVHRRELATLETQMKAYPRTMHDDQIDVVAMGVENLLWNDAEFTVIRKR